MFLTLFISCINLSETAKGCWERDRYYSPVPLFFLGFFSSLISFCCKQHLCTLDKFNNHDSIRNPYRAVFCFILPIKISTWYLMSGEGPATSYRNSNRVDGGARAVKEPLCHVGLRTSVCVSFNTSTSFVTLPTSGLREASFHNYASPFNFSFISGEGRLAAWCFHSPLSLSAGRITCLSDRSDISPWHKPCSVR